MISTAICVTVCKIGTELSDNTSRMSNESANLKGPEAPALDPAALARQPLPAIIMPMPPEALVQHLDKLARRGKLAGFAPIDATKATAAPAGSIFSIAAFGTPFDATLYAVAQPLGDVTSSSSSTRLTFSRVLKRKGLIGFGLVLLLTIWPGIELTRSLFASTFPEQRWLIDYLPYWYLPLTIISLPWGLWEAWRRSTRTSHASAHEAITKLIEDVPGAKLDTPK
jgi:hypothetical protein